MDMSELIRSAYRKQTPGSVRYSSTQMQAITRGLAQSTPISKTQIVLSQRGRTPYRGSSILPTLKRGPSIQPTAPRTFITPITTRAISAPVAPTALGRTSSIISAAPLGGGAIPTPSPGVGEGLSSTISNVGTGISDTIQKYMPIAIKVVIAIIAIKVLWWLLKGRR